MPDLIFHIGLSKCASSTLQQTVFRHEAGYLGTAPDLRRDVNLAKQLEESTPFIGRQTTSQKGLRQWVDRVREIQSERWSYVDRLILSNEILSSASRLDDRPILKVLATIKNELWRNGQVKVVLVLRSQATWLASSYAQSSSTRCNPGQLDFERTVQRHLNNRRRPRLFDYSSWVDGLWACVGQRNVCVLLLEESRTLQFWQRLADFCQLDQFNPEEMVAAVGDTRNVRKQAADQWSLSPLDIGILAKTNAEKWLNLFWPKSIDYGVRETLKAGLVRLIEARYKRVSGRVDSAERETFIRISPRVMNSIRAKCGQYNQRLATQLDQDLSSLGY